MSVDMNTTDQNIFNSRAQPGNASYACVSPRGAVAVLRSGRKIFRSKELADFSLAFPSRPVLTVKIDEGLGCFQSFLFGFKIHDCEAADDLLGFGEGAIDDRNLSAGKANAMALRGCGKSSGEDHGAILDCLPTDTFHGIHQSLGWGCGVFGVFYHHHESHRCSPFDLAGVIRRVIFWFYVYVERRAEKWTKL
jgi:hypothetical protein